MQGKTFQKEFGNLGEVRSLIPKNVRIMALTATATSHTCEIICKLLGIVDAVIVAEPPSRPNIKYVVECNPDTLEETFAPLVGEVHVCQCRHLDRTIIFC